MKIKQTFLMLCVICYSFLQSNLQAQTIQAESMTVGGPYAGKITSPFGGVGYYGNGDKSNGLLALTYATGKYSIVAKGASSNSNIAKIDLLIDGKKVGTFSFSGTTSSTSTISVTIDTGVASKTIQLLLSTDTGSNDTFVDAVTFTYLSPVPPPRAAPSVPTASAFSSGSYRNMFVESGQTASDVTAKMNALWNQYFVNGDSATQSLYYPVGTDMAYILDTGNDDIRSEGQSYGMMICVQLNHQAEFDKLWKFAKTYSQHPTGNSRAGLFSWQLNKTSPYSAKDENSAPDGEEYYATALYFANSRWGSAGTFNYKAEADNILDNMINKAATTAGACPSNLINTVEKQVIFVGCGSSATFTDPSYHLPAFYEIWAREATNNKQLWADMATTSRTSLWPNAANATTGLMPDYSEFNGAPKNNGDHGKFEYDAWRNIMNMAVDQVWFKQNTSTVVPIIDKQINFFKDKSSYACLWTLDGTTARLADHSPGLVGTNAVGALAIADAKVWPFIDEAFNTAIPSGKYRYYDGLLYMMSYMHLSGNFKLYLSNSTSVAVTGVSVSPTSVSVVAGATTPLVATVLPSNATNQNVSWTSSNTSVATVSALGVVTGVAAGTATITVTTQSGSKTATSAITVTAPNVAVTGVSVSPTSVSVVAGATITLTATVLPSNATNQNVSWASSNASVATVSASGVVTGVAVGTATITVTTQDGSKIATSTITVTAPSVAVTGVSVSPTSVSVVAGATTTLTATVLPSNATNQNVSWASSNTSVATVSALGVVTGVAAGTATITVTTQSGSKTATSTITVTAASSDNCLLARFGVPRSTPLPTLSSTYNKIYTLGSNAPIISSTNNVLNWSLSGNRLWELSVRNPNYTNLTNNVQNFAQAQPAITFSGSGIVNLDGNKYYANIVDSNNLVLVEISGKHAIYFSNSTTAPAGCSTTKMAGTVVKEENFKIFPNPVKDLFTISGLVIGNNIVITDMLGKTVFSSMARKEQEEISISGLLAGVYIVTVGENTMKLIKE